MVTVCQKLELVDGGKPHVLVVRNVVTCPFGTILPPGFIDVTSDRDQKNGIRVGVK